MHRIAALVLAFAACGAEDPTSITTADSAPAEVAAGASVQRWTLSSAAPGCGDFADLPAGTPDCSSVPVIRQGPGGECSVGCFGAAGDIRVAVGCHTCSAEYRVTFVSQ